MCYFVLLLPLTACVAAAPADSPVMVSPAPAVVDHQNFDRLHPPPDMQAQDKQEDAFTSWSFTVHVDLDYTNVSEQAAPGGVVAAIKITQVRMNLGASITIYLPPRASAGLQQHEDGHRLIAETFYKEAQSLGTAAAQPLIGQVFRAQGKDRDAARIAAVAQAVKIACDAYLKAINDPTSNASVLYDQLTDHGRNAHPTANEAAAAAIEKTRKEVPLTDHRPNN